MRSLVVLALIAMTGQALAAGSDEAALSLANQAPTAVAKARDWRLFAEGALGGYSARSGDSPIYTQRFSLGGSYDKRFGKQWRAVFSDRFDTFWQDSFDRQNSVNTLQEAYISWQPRPADMADFGRINVRQGVATGYNPTDYFRADAIRSVVSLDPSSLRNNRLGSVMVRGQRLWDGGSLTALYSPKLADGPTDDTWSPDFGATNHRDRWLLVLSQRIADSFSPQWLLYGGRGMPTQLGVNVTTLLNDATVAYLEWSGGRGASQLDQALGRDGKKAFRNRLATGLTYTAPTKLSITLEYEYDGAALDGSEWESLYSGSPADYGQYRQWVQDMQELPTKQAWFAYVTWQDALVHDLDMTAMVRLNAADHSRLNWFEARYHLKRADLSLQWQFYSGDPGSQYGAAAERQVWQGVVTYYF